MKFVITEEEKKKIMKLYEGMLVEQSFGTQLTYTSVMDIPNLSKDEIYVKIKHWLAEAYNNLNEVLQLDDKLNGLMIVKGSMRFVDAGPYYEGWVRYTLKIQVKDGKFKIEMKDLDHQTTQVKGKIALGILTDRSEFTQKGWSKNSLNDAWRILKSDTSLYFKQMVLSITEFVKTGKDDDFQP